MEHEEDLAAASNLQVDIDVPSTSAVPMEVDMDSPSAANLNSQSLVVPSTIARKKNIVHPKPVLADHVFFLNTDNKVDYAKDTPKQLAKARDLAFMYIGAITEDSFVETASTQSTSTKPLKIRFSQTCDYVITDSTKNMNKIMMDAVICKHRQYISNYNVNNNCISTLQTGNVNRSKHRFIRR